ncbi:MAG TPA: hypothetical protein PLJ60_01355 [Chryseolinea sp.]|mgnify:CR=1 FL=1|nr:hypothetical protein [Chryseolinea sp.]HPM28953.1 hypothetical protein [Chryseolinea sp.]
MKSPAKKSIPFEFVLENLGQLDIKVKAFFGCHSIYLGDKILLTLRNKKEHTDDNGVWIATETEHHANLQKLFPNMRSIKVFGGTSSNWQILPIDADDFEESVLHVCELILKHDPRIGKIPKKKKKKE